MSAIGHAPISDRYNLSAIAIRRAPLTGFLMVAILLAGVLAYLDLGRQEDPKYTVRVMVVRAAWPGASAVDVEQQLTIRLERKLQETPRLRSLRSWSKPGESIVFVELRDDFPADELSAVFYQVRKDVGDIRESLPTGVVGPFFDDEFGDTQIATYAVRGAGFDYAELEHYANDVRDRLLDTAGVEKVTLIGAQEERIFVELDSALLASYGATPADIAMQLEAQNAVVPDGVVYTAEGQVRVRVTGALPSADAVRAVPVRIGERQLRVGDLATVRRGFVDPPVYRMRFQGEPAVGLGVVMEPGANVLEVGRRLEAAVTQLRTELPAGLLVEVATFQPTVVALSVNEFLVKFAVAVVIVLAVCFASLGWRSGVIVALSIPLVLAVTVVAMWLLGISFQRISLGALIISLGLLVDDAVIAVESMERRLSEGATRLAAATHAYATTAWPMLTGTLITVAGFLPVYLAESSTGEYVGSLFIVVGIAMLTSWWVAVYFTPYLGVRLLRETHGVEAGAPPGWNGWLEALVRRCVERRRAVLGATTALFAVGALGLGLLEKQFFPYSTREEIIVDLWLPEGASTTESQTAAERLERALLDDSVLARDIRHVAAYVGGGAPRFYSTLDQQLPSSNLAQLVVTATDLEARERLIAATRSKLASDFTAVRSKVDRLPSGPPVGWPLQIRVRGPDEAVVRKVANEVHAVVAAHPDVFNVHDDWNEQVPVLRLQVDQERARALDITSSSLAASVSAALSGQSATVVRRGDDAIVVELRADRRERQSLRAVESLYVTTAIGEAVPLSQVASTVPAFEPGVLRRRDGLPSITVQGEVREGLQSPAVTLELERPLAELRRELPPGYSIEPGGAFEESVRAEASVNAILPLVLLLSMLLLLLQLNDLRKALIVLVSAPLGIIGAAAALHLTGQPFGFVATLGLIALAGMIIRNAVILVEQISREVAAGAPVDTACVDATVRRFRPIALTAMAAVLGFVPLTTSTLWGPMAIALIGGLLVATVLTITFVPALYAAWFATESRGRRALSGPAHR